MLELAVVLGLVVATAFLGGQGKDAAGDRAQREQAAAQLGLLSAVRSGRCEALQKPCSCQWPQLGAQRLRSRDQQITQLTEPGPFCVDGSLASSHKCLQRLAFTTRSRCCRPLLAKHAASGTDGVERIGPARVFTKTP